VVNPERASISCGFRVSLVILPSYPFLIGAYGDLSLLPV
jgi:hypothetical protein